MPERKNQESPHGKTLRKRLKCGCVKSYVAPAPDNGEEVWCHFHRKMTVVLYMENWQWVLKCTSCTFSRKAPGQIECGMKATSHLRKYPDHKLDVFRPDGKYVKSYGGSHQGQMVLGEEIPF